MTREAAMYLRPNVQIEPLFNQWYAGPHLVYPVTAAMNVVGSHLKLMKSYVASPQVHAQALKNPAMAGGSFLDLDGKRVDEVRALLDETQKSSKDLIELAAAVKTLDDLLRAEATGYSLEQLYPRVPDALRGYVELVYDRNDAASARFLEELVYRSPYYATSRQSFVLSLCSEDERPFVLSTPRLPDPKQIEVRVPFASEVIDDLCRARDVPVEVATLRDRLGVDPSRDELFRSLFTERPPPPPHRHATGGLRARYFGHACVLFETNEISVLTDPFLSYEYPTELPRYTYRDLPSKIDYVLLTHAHLDHTVFETLIQLRHRVGTVVIPRCGGGRVEDASLRLVLRHIGFKSVIEVDELESIDIPGGRVVGLPFFGEHGDLDVRSKIAHLLELGGHRMLLAADSNNVEPRLYDLLRDAVGEVDTIFLGMECAGAPYSWVYGPLVTKPIARKNDQSRRLNGSDFERGRHIVERFSAKRVYVYAMGQEPWSGHIMATRYTPESPAIVESDRLVAFCKERGVESERLYCQKEILF